MLVLSSSILVGLESSYILLTLCEPVGFCAYLESTPLVVAVSTLICRLLRRASSFTGDDLVSILGEAMVRMALLLVVSPDTEETWSLSATLRGEPDLEASPGLPTNFS